MFKHSSPFITTRRTRLSIRKDTYDIRKKLGLLHEPCFPIMKVIEKVLPSVDPEFNLDVVDDKEMGAVLAEAIPEKHMIKVMESVYRGACQNHYWHRMTMAHELGHYLYHSKEQLRLARLKPGARIPAACNPETQADIFAAELLMPVNLVENWTPRVIAQRCKVSFQAAECQYKQIGYLKREKKKKARSKQSIRPSR